MLFKRKKDERSRQIGLMAQNLSDQGFNSEAAILMKLSAAMLVDKEKMLAAHSLSFDLELTDFLGNSTHETVDMSEVRDEQTIKEIAHRAGKRGDREIASVLFCLLASMNINETDKLAEHIMPFIDEMQKKLERKVELMDTNAVLKLSEFDDE